MEVQNDNKTCIILISIQLSIAYFKTILFFFTFVKISLSMVRMVQLFALFNLNKFEHAYNYEKFGDETVE